MKFRVTALREDLYRGKSTGKVDAEGTVKCKDLKLNTLMRLFLEMFDSIQ